MGNYYETFYPPFFMERRYAFNAIAVNPFGYDRPDTAIINDLKKRLRELAPLDTHMVQITCEHEVVTLSGFAPSAGALRFLERVADNILGVRKVTNNLQVYRAGATTCDMEAPSTYPTLPEELDPKPTNDFMV